MGKDEIWSQFPLKIYKNEEILQKLSTWLFYVTVNEEIESISLFSRIKTFDMLVMIKSIILCTHIKAHNITRIL